MASSDEQRRRQIEEAAYALLMETGYKSASLLAIAKRAKASTETLYRWYGGKPGLFAALVEANAAKASALIDEVLAQKGDALAGLERLGPVLLGMLVGDRAIALNRAAAVDASETGVLGPILGRHGREAVAPRLDRLLLGARDAGQLQFEEVAQSRETYLSLLIGDLQVRRVTGALPALSAEAIAARSARAITQFLQLHANPLLKT
jgi:AcrR family transcriptional regulator